jgi:cation-transporting ATPase E
MRSGSAVTRDVADIVLVEDSFAALPPAQREGRRIINGIGMSLHVFLARVATQGLVIVAVTMLGLGFPYSPTQVGLTLFTVGVPTFFLTMWAKPLPPDRNLLGGLGGFVIPAAVITAGFGTAIYAGLYEAVTIGFSSGRTPAEVIGEFEKYTGLTYGSDTDFTAAAATIGAQTGLSTFFCLASFLLILFLTPPTRFFAAWTAPTADRRPTYLVGGLILAFATVLFVPAIYTYFGLAGPSGPVFVIVGVMLAIWFASLSLAYRWRLLDRVLGLHYLR